jgi:hypothetical protein
MPRRLAWDDLLIQHVPETETRIWLGYWSATIEGRVAPVFLSKFGDWFLRRPDGSTDELSVIDGRCSQVAGTPEEFHTLVNTPVWQEEHLLSFHVFQLHERGLVPKASECYAFAPHPLISGRINIDEALVMDIGVWQHICAQLICAPPSQDSK